MRTGIATAGSSLRRVALFLVACALVLRLLVPSGWMPVAHANGVTLNWCSGVSHTVPVEAEAMLAEALADKAPPKHKPAPDQPCAFAAAAQPADTLAALPVFVPPTAHEQAPALPLVAAFPGLGLAAPPPLSTGPPRLV